MLPGTIAGWAASGLPAVWAVPAGGVAVEVEAVAFWAGALAVVCAAAGVSPAAAKAIAHPISLICTPDSVELGARMRTRFSGSIGAGFRTLKRLFQDVIRGTVAGACPTA
jgi:hypothetical protein